MEFDFRVTAAAFVGLIAVGVGGLLAADVMGQDTVLMMVAPSMVVFGLLFLILGAQYGEYRAGRA